MKNTNTAIQESAVPKTLIFSFHAFEESYYPPVLGFTHFTERLTLDNCHLAEGFKAISLFTSDDASAPVLDRLYQGGTRFIALRSAGYNHVDLEHATALGITVANVPAYSPHAIAEHALAMMLTLNRKLVLADQRIKRHDFSLNGLIGFDMNGKTVGIIGMGFIGKVLARILHGMGCKLLSNDLEPDPEMTARFDVQYTSLETICREADIISIHIPLTPATKYLIDEEKIGMMKPGVMLINTARGGIVDTAAVIAALKSGQIGSFGMDVYEKEAGVFFYDYSEQVLEDDTLALLTTFPNVLITANQAFLTQTALQNISDTTKDNLQCMAEGKSNGNELNPVAIIQAAQMIA